MNTPIMARFIYLILLTLLTASATLAQIDTTYATLPKEEIVPDSPTNFGLFDEAFYQNQLFLLGESHGVQKPQEVDFELLKHLNQKVGVRHYIAEVDVAQAYYLNQFLQTGDENTLMKVFRFWVAEKAQWANKDFYKKIQRIRSLNQTLPENRRVQFVGIDRIQDKPVVADYVAEPRTLRPVADSLLAQLRASRPDSVVGTTAQEWLADEQANESAYRKLAGPNVTDLNRILTHIGNLKTVRSRETTIFTNFSDVLPRLNNEKLYGFWGFFHVLQSPTKEGSKPFASRIKTSDLPLHDKVVSITLSYLDCYSMVPTTYLPPFWQDRGKTYSRINKFNNDSELMRTEGIDAMRTATRPNSLTLFALDRTGSFARHTPIRITYSPFMPSKIEFDPKRPMTDYFQYVILVRDSDMTEPIQP
jgi:hypothetical protein